MGNFDFGQSVTILKSTPLCQPVGTSNISYYLSYDNETEEAGAKAYANWEPVWIKPVWSAGNYTEDVLAKHVKKPVKAKRRVGRLLRPLE